jgi:hypothetical protein
MNFIKILLATRLILGIRSTFKSQTDDFFVKTIEIELNFEIVNDLITGLSTDLMVQFFHCKKDMK